MIAAVKVISCCDGRTHLMVWRVAVANVTSSDPDCTATATRSAALNG